MFQCWLFPGRKSHDPGRILAGLHDVGRLTGLLGSKVGRILQKGAKLSGKSQEILKLTLPGNPVSKQEFYT